MKACKVTFGGSRYLVNSSGVVMRQIKDVSGLYVDGFTEYTMCERDEENAVLAEVARIRKNRSRRDRDQLRRDCGLVRVVGALGGVYWE